MCEGYRVFDAAGVAPTLPNTSTNVDQGGAMMTQRTASQEMLFFFGHVRMRTQVCIDQDMVKDCLEKTRVV